MYFGFAVDEDVSEYFEKHSEFPQDVTEVSRAINEEFRPGTNYYVHPEQKRVQYDLFLKRLSTKEHNQYFAEFNAQVQDLIDQLADAEEEEVDLEDGDDRVQHDRRHAYDDRPEREPRDTDEGYAGEYDDGGSWWG